jgi:uncharacterized protein (TIGR03435 family)
MRNPQILRRAFLVVAAGIVVVGAVSALRAQAPPLDTKSLAFEVASVKPDGSAPLAQGVRTGMSFPPGGRFTGTYVTLRQLIVVAYGRLKPLFGFQISGGPKWIDSDRFDIEAKAEGEASVDQRRLMIQALLTDRFKLIVRTETKELPVYALVMARSDRKFGSRLRRSAVDCAAPRDLGVDVPRCYQRSGLGTDSSGLTLDKFATNSIVMAQLANVLSRIVSRIVLDETALTGNFELDLEWLRDPLLARPPGDPSSVLPPADGPSISTALQEQLGLKLESKKRPVDVLVIDHVEQPTPD